MAASVGTAYVEVKPEMSKFGAQAATGVQSTMGGLTKVAGALGIGMGVAAGVAFGKEILTAANEAAQSANRLVAAAANDTRVSVEELSAAFEDFGLAAAIDDEELKDLASSLLSMGFKGSTSELVAEVQAIEDLSTATGKSTSMIQKFFVALNTGNMTKAIASAKMLLGLTQAQADKYTALVKEGKAAEVQQELLTLAQTKNHGAAEEQATDMDILINKWNEFKETLGVGLLAVLTEVGGIFADIVNEVEELGTVFGLTGESMGGFGGFLKSLLVEWNPLVIILKETYEGLKLINDGLQALGIEATPVTVATHELTGAEKDLFASLKETTPAILTEAEAHKQAAIAARAQRDAELALVDPVFAVIDAVNQDADAERELKDARADLKKLTAEGKKGTEEYAAAVKREEDAALAAAEAQASLLGEVNSLRHSVDKGVVSEKDAETALRDMAESAGLTKKETQGLIDKLREGKSALDVWNSTPLDSKSATLAFHQLITGADPSMQAPYPGGWDSDTSTPYPAAAGGVFQPRPGGHVIRVAEAGKPEAVVPLGGGTGPLTLRILDWRNGIAELATELDWSGRR